MALRVAPSADRSSLKTERKRLPANPGIHPPKRKNTVMITEKQAALLAQPNTAVIGVNRAQGAPQLTVVWYVWDGKDFSFSTTKNRAKYVNITRNPAISLMVDDSSTHTSVVAYGQAEIIEHDIAALARPIIEKYVPEAQREEALKGITDDPERVIVVLHPEKILP
jgi:PPOX class probable F420-dependent enzyme